MDELEPEPEPELEAEPEAELRAERFKERIYATITMVAVATGLTLANNLSHSAAALSLGTTALGLWLATVVANELAHRAVHGRASTRTEMGHAAYVAAPLLTAAAAPLLLVILSALGLMDLTTALYIAIGLELLSLFAWAFVSGLRMGDGPLPSAVGGLIIVVIGVGIALVKLIAGH